MLKFLSIAVTMGQYDLAASAVAEFPGQGSKEQTISLMKVLDLLAVEQHPNKASYRELLETFRTAPDNFMPSKRVVDVVAPSNSASIFRKIVKRP